MKKNIFVYLFCWLCAAPGASANDAVATQSDMLKLQQMVMGLQNAVQDLRLTVESQNEVIQQQNIRIQGLESGQPAQGISTRQKDSKMPLQGLSQGFNPDIGVVGTVQAHLTENTEDGEGQDTIALKELELSFSQYVDPYSRLDAIIAFNDNLEDQNVDIEEAYYSHWGLPWGFKGQIGKFRSKIGKQNLLHLHQLDTVDYPLVIQEFFGEEGLSSSGVRLQNMIPNPWDIPVELTGEVLRGNNGASFSGISRRPIFNTHVKTFFELSENTQLELGGTVMFGDENIAMRDKGSDRYGVHIFGGDATFDWFMQDGRKLKWQNEIYFQDRSKEVVVNHDPWGFYSLLDYRFSPKFSAGIRLDYVEPLDVIADHGRTIGVSPYITFWQSEFAYFRLQYQHLEPASADAKSDDALYLQANFLIGAHTHPVQ